MAAREAILPGARGASWDFLNPPEAGVEVPGDALEAIGGATAQTTGRPLLESPQNSGSLAEVIIC